MCLIRWKVHSFYSQVPAKASAFPGSPATGLYNKFYKNPRNGDECYNNGGYHNNAGVTKNDI